MVGPPNQVIAAVPAVAPPGSEAVEPGVPCRRREHAFTNRRTRSDRRERAATKLSTECGLRCMREQSGGEPFC